MNIALSIAIATQTILIYLLARGLSHVTICAGKYRGALAFISRSAGGGRQQVVGMGSMQVADLYTLRGHADAVRVAGDVLSEVIL